MPPKRLDEGSERLNITLAKGAVEALDALIPEGVYGGSRAQVAAGLIQRVLQQLRESGQLPSRKRG